MKFVQTYIVFLASGLASALPTSHSGIESSLVQDLHPALLDVRSINEPNQALQTLERRFDFRQCRRIGSTILRIGTSAAGVAFINSAAGLAQQICEEQGAPGCAQYIGYIQHGMNAIFVFATYAHGAVAEGRSGEQSSVENGVVKRASLIGLSGLGPALNDGGYSFDSVEHIDIAALKLDKRDSSDPILTHRSIFRNLTNEDGSPSSDVAFNYFDNGDVNMDVAGDMGTLAADGGVETSGLQKRYNGPGFKISWTSRKRSLLTRAHQNQMSYEIARDWADKAAFLGEGDYIGLVKTDHTANFYFRIIPETRGFGLNYESVNVCGQLAPFL